MESRLLDNIKPAVIVSALLFFGGIILLHQVVTLNYVRPFSVFVVTSSIVFGLGFGVIVGWFSTRNLLKSLQMKGEYKASKVSLFATLVGVFVFVLVSLFVETLGRAFVVGDLYFVLSALFTYFIPRLVLLSLYERQTKKVIVSDVGIFSSRIYIRPDTDTNGPRQNNQLEREKHERPITVGVWKCPICNRVNSYQAKVCLCGHPRPDYISNLHPELDFT